LLQSRKIVKIENVISPFVAIEMTILFSALQFYWPLGGTIDKTVEAWYTAFWSFGGEMRCRFVATGLAETFYCGNRFSIMTAT